MINRSTLVAVFYFFATYKSGNYTKSNFEMSNETYTRKANLDNRITGSPILHEAPYKT